MRKYKIFIPPILLFIIATMLYAGLIPFMSSYTKNWEYAILKISQMILVLCLTWFAISLIDIAKKIIYKKVGINELNRNNLDHRKLFTKYELLEKIAIFIIILVAIAVSLLLFDSVRKIGLSLFASAGVAGIVIGLAAQKLIGTILAGLQIAITQPIRQDDELLIENEWGRVEEINLTYVVIKLWDKRRLILPSTYFIEKPFQNWTKSSSEIIGSIFLTVDYSTPIARIRQHLGDILESNNLWDQKIQAVHVTDCLSDNIQIRILVGARNSSEAFELRAFVREQMITYMQQNFPESLPKRRITVEK